MPDLVGFDLGAQIAEIRREIQQREKVYPRMVAAGRLTQARADHQLEALRAVLRTLEQLQARGEPQCQ